MYYHALLQSKILTRKLKRGRSKKEMKSQPKHPWCKKVAAKALKKGHAEKDVKSKWMAKAHFDFTKHYCCLPL